MGGVSLVNVAADAARRVAAPIRTADRPRVGRTGQGTEQQDHGDHRPLPAKLRSRLRSSSVLEPLHNHRQNTGVVTFTSLFLQEVNSRRTPSYVRRVLL